jgi:predicted PurR-regulated permease PerM
MTSELTFIIFFSFFMIVNIDNSKCLCYDLVMISNKYLQIYILVFIATILSIVIVKDFITPVLLGLFMAIVTNPLHTFFLSGTSKLHWRNITSLFIKDKTDIDGNKAIAAGLTVLATIFILAIGLWTAGSLAGNSVKAIVNQPLDEGVYSILSNQSFKSTFGGFYDEKEVKSKVSDFLKQYEPSKILTTGGTSLITNSESRVTISRITGSFFTNLFAFIIDLIVFIFTWIVILISGRELLEFIYSFTFLNKSEQEMINLDVIASVRNVILGNITSGVVMALVSTGVCIYFNIPLVGVWALAAFAVGFLPLTPSELAVFPALIGVFFTQGPTVALVIAIILELFILVLNNAILPKITAGKETNPLLILLSVFTAIKIFGFAGFVIGPVFVYLLMALFKIAYSRMNTLESRTI